MSSNTLEIRPNMIDLGYTIGLPKQHYDIIIDVRTVPSQLFFLS